MITYMETWNHPEAGEDEVFVGNYDKVFFEKEIRWKTKRLGKVAYDPRTGKKMGFEGYFPVFVKQSELAELNIKIVMREMKAEV